MANQTGTNDDIHNMFTGDRLLSLTDLNPLDQQKLRSAHKPISRNDYSNDADLEDEFTELQSIREPKLADDETAQVQIGAFNNTVRAWERPSLDAALDPNRGPPQTTAPAAPQSLLATAGWSSEERNAGNDSLDVQKLLELSAASADSNEESEDGTEDEDDEPVELLSCAASMKSMKSFSRRDSLPMISRLSGVSPISRTSARSSTLTADEVAYLVHESELRRQSAKSFVSESTQEQLQEEVKRASLVRPVLSVAEATSPRIHAESSPAIVPTGEVPMPNSSRHKASLREAEKKSLPHLLMSELWKLTNHNEYIKHIIEASAMQPATSDSDVQRASELLALLNRFEKPEFVFRDCNCSGRAASAKCCWALCKALTTPPFIALITFYLRQENGHTVNLAVELLLSSSRLAYKAHNSCTAVHKSASPDACATPVAPVSSGQIVLALMYDAIEEASIVSVPENHPVRYLMNVLHMVFVTREVELDHVVLKRVAKCVFAEERYEMVNLLLYCVAIGSRRHVGGTLDSLMDLIQGKKGEMVIVSMVDEPWYALSALILRQHAEVLHSDKPFLFELIKSSQNEKTSTTATKGRHKANMSNAMGLLAQLTTKINQAMSEVELVALIVQFCTTVLMRLMVPGTSKPSLKSNFSVLQNSMGFVQAFRTLKLFNSNAVALMRMILLCLVHKVEYDSSHLEPYAIEDDFMENLLLLGSSIEEMVFYTPLSYQERLREVNQHSNVSEMTLIDKSKSKSKKMAMSKSSPTERSRSSHEPVDINEVLTHLDGVDFCTRQRSLGIHIHPNTGDALDLPVVGVFLKTLVRARDQLRARPGAAASARFSRAGLQRQNEVLMPEKIRHEIGFFQHLQHYLEHCNIRNEKKPLASILSNRLLGSRRNFKTFSVDDESNWDKYVVMQLSGALLAEQRRSATCSHPKALYSFDVLRQAPEVSHKAAHSSPVSAKAWTEMHCEVEVFNTHTHTIGDYRPILLGDLREKETEMSSRRTQGRIEVKDFGRVDDNREDSKGLELPREEQRQHNHADCLCAMILWYKGRDVIQVQDINRISSIYLLDRIDEAALEKEGKLRGKRPDFAMQRRYPFSCVLQFIDGTATQEICFKKEFQRTEFAAMCIDLYPVIAIIERSAATPRVPTSIDVKSCVLCDKSFTMFLKKYRCKYCMASVCKTCSPHRERLIEMGYDFDQSKRVCNRCFPHLNDAHLGKVWKSRSKEQIESLQTQADKTRAWVHMSNKKSEEISHLIRIHHVAKKHSKSAANNPTMPEARSRTASLSQVSPAMSAMDVLMGQKQEFFKKGSVRLRKLATKKRKQVVTSGDADQDSTFDPFHREQASVSVRLSLSTNALRSPAASTGVSPLSAAAVATAAASPNSTRSVSKVPKLNMAKITNSPKSTRDVHQLSPRDVPRLSPRSLVSGSPRTLGSMRPFSKARRANDRFFQTVKARSPSASRSGSGMGTRLTLQHFDSTGNTFDSIEKSPTKSSSKTLKFKTRKMVRNLTEQVQVNDQT